ncbi:ubiquitin carboxyl-terminal hydrolase 5-like isoform X2 [Biomphalaria glabrata]|uniref:Ubiquitin carboxyl-terminal hydrolase n=1 Tax=Biomphalaria glabrata TaxID=6526 RepID=A0A9W2YP15_BIOGL|nr:ubiquitin carboxyl-terminal hydrolase 5-like isoform X2 [Biomphalaria glabrata]
MLIDLAEVSEESPDGLYICMNTFLGVGKRHLHPYSRKSKHDVFLHIQRLRKEIPKDETANIEKPTKLAIGVAGGFQTDEKRYEFEERVAIVIPDKGEIGFPHESLPMQIQQSAALIIAAEDAIKMEEAAAMAGTWEGEPLVVSKYAENLQQLNNGKKIPPSGWKCEKCELMTNLWLNLTDGSILCGRRFFDGSGGNNHAVEHFQEVKYPLAVKLGTITATSGDVYSYVEDDMVEDPYLAKHLAHFGINVAALEKTDKTMTELEIDINQKIGEWDVIQEAGSQLRPCYGSGYTGMRNLGNSCYLNSVMQVLFSIPDFQRRYYVNTEQLVQNAPPNPASDFNFQMSKLAFGLLSGEYSKNVEAEKEDSPPGEAKYLPSPQGIRPHVFKNLVGKGHVEFSTKKQQDAQEFFLHMVSLIEKNSRDSVNPCDCFRFQVEERVMCSISKKVRYSRREDYCLSLPVPMEAAINKEEVRKYNEQKSQAGTSYVLSDPKSIVRPIIPFTECLSVFQESEPVEEFYSSAIQGKTLALKTTRLASFPDYLMVQLRKFTVGDDWVPRKLDVSVQVPDELDLSYLRGYGLQSGEEELPAGDSPPEPPMEICEITVGQLVDMGFPREACRKAVFKTKNQGVEAAMNWVMEHMEDPDFSEPLEVPTAGTKHFEANPEGLGMLMSMGFNLEQATKALKATDNNTERAVDWIFSHADEISQPMETEDRTEGQSQAPKFKDGSEKYKLVAFISHMGTSTSVGHYVCHILKDGQWVIFNDEKVALSEHPPKDLAYLYLYQRLA